MDIIDPQGLLTVRALADHSGLSIFCVHAALRRLDVRPAGRVPGSKSLLFPAEAADLVAQEAERLRAWRRRPQLAQPISSKPKGG